MGWRYLAQRLTGDGAGEFLHTDVPLRGAQITDVLSGPLSLTGTISPEVAGLKDANGRPLFEEWSTALYAEADGQIRCGGILVHSNFNGPEWGIEAMGFAGYPTGMPFTESFYGVEVDPLDMARKIWDHLQGQPFGDLGVIVDPLLSGLKIGTELEQVEFDTESGPVSFEAGPYKLAWYQTDDLGKEFDDLASETPFDYHEEHEWNEDHTDIIHRIRIGYPRWGTRRTDLRFALDENIQVVPTVERDGDVYANEILALGAGEGRDMLRQQKSQPDGRLRRVNVVTDKSLRSLKRLDALATTELRKRAGLERITQIVVRDHPNAAIGAWGVGDDILVQGNSGWEDFAIWCRILSSTIAPDDGDAATLTIARTDAL